MSSAHRYQATWRDVIFNRVYDNTGVVDDPTALVAAYANSDFRLDSFDATRVESADYRELRQWLEGAEGNEAFEGAMLAIGSGIILGSSHGDLEDKTALLRSQFSIANSRIAADAATPAGVLPFDFRRATVAAPGYLALRMYARPASGRPVVIGRMREGLSRRFRFSLISFDPCFVAQSETSTSCSTNGSTIVTNNGDFYARPYIDVVVSSGTGTFVLTLNGVAVLTFTAVPVGTWTFDTRRSTFTKADGTNGMQYRTSGFISNVLLLPGANTFSTSGSSGLNSVTVRHRDAYA